MGVSRSASREDRSRAGALNASLTPSKRPYKRVGSVPALALLEGDRLFCLELCGRTEKAEARRDPEYTVKIAVATEEIRVLIFLLVITFFSQSLSCKLQCSGGDDTNSQVKSEIMSGAVAVQVMIMAVLAVSLLFF